MIQHPTMRLGRGLIAGGAAPEFAFLQGALDNANSATYTFTAQSLGTAHADRIIIAAVMSRNGGSVSLSSVTIGGVTASIVVSDTLSNDIAALAVAAVPSGSTGDVVVTHSTSGSVRCAVALYRAVGFSATPGAVASDISGSRSISIAVPTDGVAIGAFKRGNSVAITWTGVDEDYNVTSEAASRLSSASRAYPGGGTQTVEVNATAGVLVAGTWGP